MSRLSVYFLSAGRGTLRKGRRGALRVQGLGLRALGSAQVTRKDVHPAGDLHGEEPAASSTGRIGESYVLWESLQDVSTANPPCTQRVGFVAGFQNSLKLHVRDLRKQHTPAQAYGLPRNS